MPARLSRYACTDCLCPFFHFQHYATLSECVSYRTFLIMLDLVKGTNNLTILSPLVHCGHCSRRLYNPDSLRVLLDFVPFVLVEPGRVPRTCRPDAGLPMDG